MTDSGGAGGEAPGGYPGSDPSAWRAPTTPPPWPPAPPDAGPGGPVPPAAPFGVPGGALPGPPGGGSSNRGLLVGLIAGLVVFLVVVGCVAAAVTLSRREAASPDDFPPPPSIRPPVTGRSGPGPGSTPERQGGAGPVGTAPTDPVPEGQVVVDGEALPPLGRGRDEAVGQTIPAVAGNDLAGRPMVIAADGRPKVIMFLAHWCPHCQAEVPRIQAELDAQGLPDDVDLVAVATSISPSRSNYPPARWLAGEHWGVPTLEDDDDNAAGAAFGVSSFPFFVVVNADGEVVQRASGELDPGDFAALVDAARG